MKRNRNPRPGGKAPASMSALDAISEAQKIAFAPLLFQAAVCLRDFGILAFLDGRADGETRAAIASACGVSDYGAGVLLDAGLGIGLVEERTGHDGGLRYALGKTGHFFLHDRMTRVNTDFVGDVCYRGMEHLKEAVATGAPAGLRVFGEWPTIYQGLSSLPEPARSSWFAFDHFYSDQAFDVALREVFALSPRPTHIYDVGGNTGRWALRCVAHDPDVRVTVLDLPQQVALLRQAVAGQNGADRIDAVPVNVLEAAELPGEADVWWMSQFLDCFGKEQVTDILRLIRRSMKPDARVCILETFCDRQRFPAAALSLNAGSLYFTCMANGNSRFYRATEFGECVASAGFRVEREINDIGIGGHTLLVCGRS
ncbi:SAM-dependent methyltransferase [Opitutaceae bacterium TAV4]|nr:SAM-dependent methyltransferase [Opitutaceae bacterium TAV4]RRJ99383.1 SAM-dependent methyltransferase [Opitutaceae bacterium TAV3]